MFEVNEKTTTLRATFCVERKPYCVYIVDGEKRILNFLKSIDYGYFDFVLKQLIDRDFDDDLDRKRASVQLRITYLHALETFYTVLLAAIQAPHCPSAYFLKLSNSQLRSLVTLLTKPGAKIISPHKKIDLTWEGLARHLLPFLNARENGGEIQAAFASAWARFSQEFLKISTVNEYNSLKHGFRTKAGGFHLSISPEKEYGVANTEEKQDLGGSQFGTSFPVSKHFEHLGKADSKRTFQLGESHVNWDVDNISFGIQVLSWSIQNVVAYMRAFNGEPQDDIKVVVPVDVEVLKMPFKKLVGVDALSFDVSLKEEFIEELSDKEIRRMVDQ